MNLDNSYSRLPAGMFAAVAPETASNPVLLAWNAPLADDLGLKHLGADPDKAARIFSGSSLPAEIEAVALAYAGHQFGVFVPQLGDGRAALLGEVVDRDGERRDIQLKGSGRTPFSRGGDGRSWLGPVLREYLVSEAMHRLGVPTTRGLAAVLTGEHVYRERPLPGAVFTRVAASHLRIGSFEYLAARNEAAALRTLTDYAIARHFPGARDAANPHEAFFEAVALRQADLVARWMALGFIHGVMNTDNMSIAGETLDYGPCAFMDEFRYARVFSSIDHYGRYAYANQPLIAQWNLARLAECLLQISDSRPAFEATLAAFQDRYNASYRQLMSAKLGFTTSQSGDEALIDEWLQYLEDHELDYTLSFRELATCADSAAAPRFGDFEAKWRHRIAEETREPPEVTAAMNRVNPLFIPRNHRIEAAIQDAIDGDMTGFRELDTVLAKPFEDQPDLAHYALPPAPEERVTQTFCGT